VLRVAGRVLVVAGEGAGEAATALPAAGAG
jgi:hypothetical protein